MVVVVVVVALEVEGVAIKDSQRISLDGLEHAKRQAKIWGQK